MKKIIKMIILLSICFSLSVFPLDLGYADETAPTESVYYHINSTNVLNVFCAGITSEDVIDSVNDFLDISISDKTIVDLELREALTNDFGIDFSFNVYSKNAGNTIVSFSNKENGEVYVNYEIVVSDHTFESEIITEADNYHSATIKYTCTECDYSYIEEGVEYCDHQWSSEYAVDKLATCTEEGSESIHCMLCGKVKEDTIRVIPKTNHDLIKIDAKEPTEDEKGNIEYWICSVCGRYFSDQEGNNQISKQDTIIPRIGISYASDFSWSISDTGVLTISGTGHMPDYDDESECPWYNKHLNIKSIKIINGITGIGSYAFKGCTRATSISIPNSVTEIGERAFFSCWELTSCYLPASVNKIRPYAFGDCRGLQSVSINGNLNIIEDGLFYNCHELKNISIPSGVTSIGKSAFAGCGGLTEIVLPSITKEIGNSAFNNCYGLLRVYIPNGVTTIGENAFYSCTKLTSITIPNSVVSIGKNVFYNCRSLEELSLPFIGSTLNDNNTFKDYFGATHEVPKTLKRVIITGSITNIKYRAFASMGNIEIIVLPDTVTKIDSYAFYDCKSLREINIPDGVTAIEDHAFTNCSNIESMALPEAIKNIKAFTFSGCSALSTINIPDGVTTIERYAFNKCNNLSDINFPDSIISIGENSFYECKSLTDVILNNVEIIGPYAFYCCYNMTNLVLSENLREIGDYAFYTCWKISKFVVYDSLIKIGEYAFANPQSHAIITIPESVNYIGASAFEGWHVFNKFFVVEDSYAYKWALNNNTNPNLAITIVQKSGEHYYYYETTKYATCTESGEAIGKCSVCDKSETVDIPATGHSVETTVTTASLTENGISVSCCTTCGEVLSEKTIYRPKTFKLSAAAYSFDGKVKKPTVKITDANGKTIAAANYTVSYASGCKNVGSYKVTIKMKGNYTGTKTLTFKINPKGTTVKSLTAAKKALTVKWTKQATKMSTSVITGYQIQLATDKAFTKNVKNVTVKGYSAVSKKVTGLKAKTTYYVRIRTYKTVSGTNYYSPWSAAKYKKTK